jgi:hypothetical protein
MCRPLGCILHESLAYQRLSAALCIIGVVDCRRMRQSWSISISVSLPGWSASAVYDTEIQRHMTHLTDWGLLVDHHKLFSLHWGLAKIILFLHLLHGILIKLEDHFHCGYVQIGGNCLSKVGPLSKFGLLVDTSTLVRIWSDGSNGESDRWRWAWTLECGK